MELCYAAWFGFYVPRNQIGHMSLNGLKRQVATQNKNQIKIQMANCQLHWIR
jgi:hypothetical protein